MVPASVGRKPDGAFLFVFFKRRQHPPAYAGGSPGRVRSNYRWARFEPDGSVWDCPSDRRIAATPPARRRSIRGGDARTLFAARPACTDCSLFSRDCVNMWPLVLDMPRLLSTGAAP